MDELVRWLGEQLDEDERIARAATPGPWEWTLETDVWDQNGPTLIRAGHDGYEDRELVEVLAGWGHDAWGLNVSEADKAHIAAHDPAQVLREIEAKRQIVDRYAWLREHGDTGGTAWVLPLLALPYANRPGYREEWRP